MAAGKPSKNEEMFTEQYIRALIEKDRSNYSGKFVQGFVHNANGPLQNLTMLTEMLLSGLELRIVYSGAIPAKTKNGPSFWANSAND